MTNKPPAPMGLPAQEPAQDPRKNQQALAQEIASLERSLQFMGKGHPQRAEFEQRLAQLRGFLAHWKNQGG